MESAANVHSKWPGDREYLSARSDCVCNLIHEYIIKLSKQVIDLFNPRSVQM